MSPWDYAPSPVRNCPAFGSADVEFWLKDDGELHPIYGGNKARKLPRLLAEAKARRARRIFTFGPAGSHHVLSTALLAREEGFDTAAVLTPQPATAHAQQMLRAIVGQKVEIHAASSLIAVPAAFARAFRPGDYLIPPGASNVLGALAYADAVRELRRQITAGLLPDPDVIVVALGSGGTAGGLLAGVIEQGMKARIAAVQVVGSRIAGLHALLLARAVLSRRGVPSAELRRRLTVERGQLGAGYGIPTPASERAASRARELGLATDPTYTAKALAHALDLTRVLAGSSKARVVLYWNTLSASPLEPLSDTAPPLENLPPHLRRLLAPLQRA